MTTFRNGDVVKFIGPEPCVIYHIVDDRLQMIFCEDLHVTCAHIRIEVLGWVPLEVLAPVIGSPDNVLALDMMMKKLNMSN